MRLIEYVPPAAQREVQVDAGWVHFDPADERTLHWAHTVKGKTRFPCGLKLPRERSGELVRVWSDDPTRSARQGLISHGKVLCPRCVSELVRMRHDLPFKHGDAVVSRACGMTLYGRIAEFFEDLDGQPQLNLTRFWPRAQLDEYENPREWYRAASECQTYDARKKPEPRRKPTLRPVPLFGCSA
ncbi:hypothetical protein [Deinococcus radiotolerans]|uniref:Uncharacterized protein n=1 Tax=Deinococcus radiotolerans TaxID=1309407 RepID=A0ABQ2FQ44_9DEIO|nr:hypothetical protein [Deinococcus radiotolerans]GGL15480.1 hypothetical protein GCM10010844_37920 [Deinococcus radiotolerans]